MDVKHNIACIYPHAPMIEWYIILKGGPFILLKFKDKTIEFILDMYYNVINITD